MMTSSLDRIKVAMQLCKMGWYIFPVNQNKVPFKDFNWKKQSSKDHEQVSVWLDEYPNCNFAVNCERSGLIVLDIDIKKGKNGFQSLKILEEQFGELPETLCVETPSGGRHYYFEGMAANSVEKLGSGLDTRGIGGYVVAAGGVDSQGSYEFICRKAPKQVPDWLVELLARDEHDDDREVVLVEDFDLPENVAAACAYLKDEADPAIEGQGGDATTLKIAMEMRDFGLTEDTALSVMSTHYNPRCTPPWDEDELMGKINNAYAYAKNPAGSRAASFTFDEVELEEPIKKKQNTLIRSAAKFNEDNIEPRRWIYGTRFIRGYVTVTVSPGGIGKSTLAIAEAVAIATGHGILGTDVHERGPVWMFNTEDPQDELERRVIACAKNFGVKLSDLADLHVSSGRTAPLRLVSADGEVNETGVKKVIETIKQLNIAMVVFDPFVRLHAVEENNNVLIDLVVQQLSRIAEETQCAVHVIHHTRKLGDAGGRGNAETARGASSLISAARVAHTIDGMTVQEGQSFGLNEDEVRWYLRLDDAKSNMAAPQHSVQWFMRKSIRLSNGDDVGTVEPVQLRQAPAPLSNLATDIAGELYEAMTTNQLKFPLKIKEAVVFFETARANGALLFSEKTKSASIAKHIENATPIEVDGWLMSVEKKKLNGIRVPVKHVTFRKPDLKNLSRLMPNSHHHDNIFD